MKEKEGVISDDRANKDYLIEFKACLLSLSLFLSGIRQSSVFMDHQQLDDGGDNDGTGSVNSVNFQRPSIPREVIGQATDLTCQCSKKKRISHNRCDIPAGSKVPSIKVKKSINDAE